MTSAIPPSWRPDARVRFYLRAPVLLSPLFMVASLRLYREIAAAAPTFGGGVGMALGHGWNVLTHMFSPARMARRVHLLEDVALEPELAALDIPTLVITGEPGLDRVVPVESTREYLRLWPKAQSTTLEHTGHLGSITRPDEFAGIVTRFARSASYEEGRRVG